jgi:ABC-type nitrate/sulfonate/bicarbonate transport system permease component
VRPADLTDSALPVESVAAPPLAEREGLRVRRPWHRVLLARLNAIWPPALIVAGLFALWEGYVRWRDVDPTVLPPPSTVAPETYRDWENLQTHTLVTLQETVYGLLLAVGIAFAIGLFIDRFEWVRRSVYPVCVSSQTIPIVAIAPLMIIWFDLGMTPKVLLVAFYTFFPIVVGLVQGLASTDPDAMNLLRTMGAKRRQLMWRVRLPSALPQFFTGLKITVTYAVVAAVLAEFVGSFEGLGIYMQQMRNGFRTDLVIGAAFVTTILTLLLFAVVVILERLVMPWYRPAQERKRW